MRIVAFLKSHRRWFLIPIGAVLVLVAAVALALAIVSPRLTPYLEGPEFRAELDKQISKGLHFDGKFGPITRTGFDTAWVGEFHAKNGTKAMKTLDAYEVSGKFNPWGVFLRRWQLDYIHVKRGKVEIQVYEPKPDNKPPKPWYAVFLPTRVHLMQVTCDHTDITWRAQGKPGGIFGTQVLITPYGHDFEYRAQGGEMRTGGLTPDLDVRSIHMTITKKLLSLYECALIPQGNKKGSLLATGELGMRDDKHVDLHLVADQVPIAPWLPGRLAEGTKGLASGEIRWKGGEQTLEASSGEGHLRIAGAELVEQPILDFLASATARKSLKSLDLTECEVKFRWKYPRFEITSIAIAAEEKIALRGAITVNKQALSGELDFGIAPTYLDWLPKAQEQIFTRKKDGLIWTKVRLSGTLKDPRDDLTPRLAEALKKDPAAAAGLFLRGAGEWIEQKLKGN